MKSRSGRWRRAQHPTRRRTRQAAEVWETVAEWDAASVSPAETRSAPAAAGQATAAAREELEADYKARANRAGQGTAKLALAAAAPVEQEASEPVVVLTVFAQPAAR